MFNFAAAVSLLLCLAAVMLWVRSRQATVVLAYRQWKQTRWQAVLDRGRVGVNNQPQLDWEQKQAKALIIQRYFAETLITRAEDRLRNAAGTSDAEMQALKDDVATARKNYNHVMTLFQTRTMTSPAHHNLPLSLLAGLAAVLPALWLWSVRRRTAVSGVCQICCYNLTGNTSGVCPECGTPVPKEPAEKSPGSRERATQPVPDPSMAPPFSEKLRS